MSRESISSIKPATETVSGILQRKCDCGKPASPIGEECEDCREQAGLGLQARLTIGASNDPLELEADRAAAAVMQMRLPRIRNQAASPPTLSRNQAGGGDAGASRVPASVTQTLKTPGEPLAPATRAFFEPRFGRDLSRVRIHRDASAAASARAVSAQAYTVGNRIAFGAGRYQPESEPGRELLAHELAHTIQQLGGDAQSLARRPTPGGFFANIGRGIIDAFRQSETDYDDADLFEYLREINRADAIEGDFDSDNKARAIVGRWRAGNSRFSLTAKIKSLLVREMLDGYTGDADENAILALLQNSPDSELERIFREAGIDNLLDAVDGEENDILKGLLRGYQQRQQTTGATPGNTEPPITDIPGIGIQREMLAYLRQLDLLDTSEFRDRTLQFDPGHGLAREIIDRWASGDQRYFLPPHRKQLLVKELLTGIVSEADQQQVLKLLRGRDKLRADIDLELISDTWGNDWIRARLRPPWRDQYSHLRQQLRDRVAANDALRQPDDKIERIVVDQEIPQTITLHWRSGATDSDICSTGKGHCCVDENDAEGAACTASESTQADSGCTPVGTHLVTRQETPQTNPKPIFVNPYFHLWTQFDDSREIRLLEWHHADGTPLSDGNIWLRPETASKVFEDVVIGQTQVIVRGLPRPRCNWPALQAQWSEDFSDASHPIDDTEPVSKYAAPILDPVSQQHHLIPRMGPGTAEARDVVKEILGLNERELRHRLRGYKRKTGSIPTASQILSGKQRKAKLQSIQSIAADIPRCVPTQTVEERRLQTNPEPATILGSSGFDQFAPRFEQQLRGTTSYSSALSLVRQQAELLWQAGLDRAQSDDPNTPADTDDRPLYWARLQMSQVLRNWNPSWLNQQIYNPERTGSVDDIRRDKARLLLVFERASRGMDSAWFTTQPGQKRILISGFDPFGLHSNIDRGNPSGAAVLALDGSQITSAANSSAQVQGVIFPVRFADFDAGLVENFFWPFIHGPKPPDMIMTISQGNAFAVEQFAGRRRSSGPFLDNSDRSSGGTLAQPVESPSLTMGPEFTETSLPAAAIRTELGRDGASEAETRVTEIRDGETRPVHSTGGPTAGSTAVRGSGGGFLSNEIFYRTSLMRDQAGVEIPLGHLHTPAIDPDARASERAASRDAIVARIKTILQATIDEI